MAYFEHEPSVTSFLNYQFERSEQFFIFEQRLKKG